MENSLQQGISAAKAGDKARAYQFLTKATQDNATTEQAWLWLSGVVENASERLFCLDNALRINPNNEPAKSKATELRQKGIFPSSPMPPTSHASSSPAQSAVPQPLPASRPLQEEAKAVRAETASAHRTQPDVSAFYKFAAVELARKQSPQVIAKKLTEQGITPAEAGRIVEETKKVLQNARGNQYKKRMTRGLLWVVVGIVLTCGTLAFSSNLGGKYVLFYGAIIYGIIDFIAGLIGWLSNR